ncbi:hypothetical protein K4K49_005231 [Colletotrichum sp. SAR 10_70]|nr:hypothetical protein K4K50_004811 [Colletotrichum sp. SAR 10_71]KAI8184424.1 hypothetical protein K4K51_012519 [Colletotrichum sp. SAR 10_75]KAI8197610.1 hypothetical protein K4K49_005231 [Colletotrichum sp. SAR 10_70]KAI8225524.1 hypothetical protein K4K54_004478 [Colletotrichum sp. SAR 10_86]
MDSLKGKGRLSDNPPPYSQDNEEIPTYQAPSTGFENPPSDSKTPLNTLAKFPPYFQCYLDKQEGFYYLGPISSEERLFAFSASARLQTTMQPLHLHNGPSERDPIIVRMTQKNPRSVSFVATITLHDPSDPHTVVEEISYEKPVNSRSSSVFASCLAFRLKVGKEGREEEFQWRRSSGSSMEPRERPVAEPTLANDVPANIVQITHSDAVSLTITLRWAAGHSLDHFIKSDTKRCTLTHEDARLLWKQISSALAYTHSKSIIHDDVKPHNIVWNEQLKHAVLIDFGAALVNPESLPEGGWAPSGTPPYTPPEFFEKKKCQAGDVWATKDQ